jgi:hypothetical protein
MAQTKRKRRRKHRGTQGGGLDRRPRRGRPRSKEEARAQARRNSELKRTLAPSWGSAFRRGLVGAAIFLLLMVLAFGRGFGEAIALSAVMLVMYVPLGYYMDRFFYRRRLQQARKAALAAKQQHQGRG